MSDDENSYEQSQDYAEDSQMVDDGSSFQYQDDQQDNQGRSDDEYEEDDGHQNEEEEDEDQEYSHVSYQHSSDLEFRYQIRLQPGSDSSQQLNQSQTSQQVEVPQSSQGLPVQVLEQIPVMQWKVLNKTMDGPENCIFCLRHYEVGQNLRVLTCLHRFHKDCIDVWFGSNKTCPTCRNSLHT